MKFDTDQMSFEPSNEILKLHALCWNFCENCFCLQFYTLFCAQLIQSKSMDLMSDVLGICLYTFIDILMKV